LKQLSDDLEQIRHSRLHLQALEIGAEKVKVLIRLESAYYALDKPKLENSIIQ
jgi:hypothetical protein